MKLKPGDLCRYTGSSSWLDSGYNPEAMTVTQSSGFVTKGDLVMIIAVMPKEALVLSSKRDCIGSYMTQLGWLVTTFIRKVGT